MLKKNEEYIVEIIDNGYEGEGIAKLDNFTVFIPGALKGEKVKIVILHIKKYNNMVKELYIFVKLL